MFSLRDGTLCSRKRDQIKAHEESFHGSYKRIKQEDQRQAKLEKNTMLTKPDIQLHLETKSETCQYHKTTLDLELNLSSSSSSNVKTLMKKDERPKQGALILIPSKKETISGRGTRLSRSPSWLAFEGEDDGNDDQKKKEMVTTVCMKCNMLVMISKSTLVCPNCKFTHPDDHTDTKQFKPLSLFKLLC
ncbi:unnamed protein product [Cochlearia groenlandica]